MNDQKHDRTEHPSGEYSDEETARRRDAVIKRMLRTPPQPRSKKPKERPTSKGRVHKGRTRR